MQKLAKRELEKSITIGDFNTLHLVLERVSRQKENQQGYTRY